ncbi:acyl-CoA dehydrogenase family protein [Mycolicibacterium baixiangningiae]|uniref:acyl-CoA dehydrogenase family protein n=1 Tax=Mycolicibacterium baixiangningiae TaxID=2761578 RepID=UPI0018D0168B|nr:acyl-CoA dehydrogenase family protein [Mycolicibacterium baixiangningiae]
MTQIVERQDAVTEELVARARAAVPTLAAHAEQTERDLRVAPESAAAAAEAGAFALSTPRRYGGVEADTTTTVRVVAELGRGCGSTAWVAAVSGDAKRMFQRFLSETARDEFFADPDVRLCGSAHPTGRSTEVPGGVRVSGRWSYASGCDDAQWAVLGAPIFEGDRQRDEPTGPLGWTQVLVPTSSLAIDRTWDMAGLRGTGSHTLVADDVFVPASHMMQPDLADAQAMGRFVAVSLTTFAPLLGIAQAALDHVASILTERRPPMSAYANMTESPSARQLFADATLLLAGARRGVLHIAATVDGLSPGQRELSAVEEAELRMELISAAKQCRQAVELLLDLHGSSSFATSNPLQRMWRDLAVGTRHGALTSYMAAEAYARSLVAVE